MRKWRDREPLGKLARVRGTRGKFGITSMACAGFDPTDSEIQKQTTGVCVF